MEKIFQKLEIAFEQLQKQNSCGHIQVDKLFANELNIKVKGVGNFNIYEDRRSQLLVIESPVNGIYSFEWHSKYNLWRSSSKEFILCQFMKEEFQNIVKGSL